jgi:hypothetical protein
MLPTSSFYVPCRYFIIPDDQIEEAKNESAETAYCRVSADS